VRVESLATGGPASRAGLEPGDFIVAFDGVAVEGIDTLHRLLSVERIGKPLAITVLRGTRKLELRIISVETAPFDRARE
jgi:S1-C subfamily serine protease